MELGQRNRVSPVLGGVDPTRNVDVFILRATRGKPKRDNGGEGKEREFEQGTFHAHIIIWSLETERFFIFATAAFCENQTRVPPVLMFFY